MERARVGVLPDSDTTCRASLGHINVFFPRLRASSGRGRGGTDSEMRPTASRKVGFLLGVSWDAGEREKP